ncbi:11407_t:CDS:2 [Diversispora eburnea]|uniref:11407_t:CDS:1 n=1 Tax=Diversispora eburnea TaxID=1213867 RepID=A0A9N8YZ57_9GLOM|nr:11407_t:CDS:2 [Diversispora eburnea]
MSTIQKILNITEDNNISNRKTKREYLPKEPSLLEKHYSVSKKVLGRGSFAVVKECTDRQQMLTTELDVLKQVNHPNIVSLHDLYETKDAVYIITDLALGGELYNQLLQRGSYTEKDAANLIEQIAHRDLKPENLLFSDKSEFSTLKITDFGLSKILKHHDDILMTACGTPGYVAPEVLTQNGYGKSVDIWSIGVILYTVLCGYTPFWGENQKALFDSILKGVYHFDEDYWSDISDEAKDLINKMLEYNPDKRITAHDALQHPWFKSINVIQGVTRMRKLNDKQSHPSQQYINNYDKVNRINLVNIINLVNTLGSSELFGHIENEIIDEYTKDVNDEKMETNKILINTNSIWSSEGSESDISSIYSISTTSLSLTPSIPNIP